MGYQANVIPLRCVDKDSHEPNALRLGPDDMSAAKLDTDTHTKRRATRDRLFIPSTAWPEFAAVVAAGVSGRSVGLWLVVRVRDLLAVLAGGVTMVCLMKGGAPCPGDPWPWRWS